MVGCGHSRIIQRNNWSRSVHPVDCWNPGAISGRVSTLISRRLLQTPCSSQQGDTMKTVAISLVLAFVCIVCRSLPVSAGESGTNSDDVGIKQALEAQGASVETNDKHQVTTVRFTNPTLRDAIALLRKLPALENVGLQKSATPVEDLVVLQEIPGLKKLWLDADQVNATGMAVLVELPRLESLYLDGSGITDETIESLRQLRSLNTLHLGSTRVTKAGFQHVAGLSELVTFGISNLDWE